MRRPNGLLVTWRHSVTARFRGAVWWRGLVTQWSMGTRQLLVTWCRFVTQRAFMTRCRCVTPFVDGAANGDTAAVSDAATVGDVALFDVTYKMHAFHPRQYICTLRMARQMRRGEALLLLASLAKAKHPPRLYMSTGNGGSPRFVAISDYHHLFDRLRQQITIYLDHYNLLYIRAICR